MFVEGVSWRKKMLAAAVMYLIFLGLGLMYASRIFGDHQLSNDGLLIILPLVVLCLVWFKYKQKTDAGFSARVAARKANPSPEAKAAGKASPLYVVLFHLLFFALVLGFKHVLDVTWTGLSREREIIAATMAATALAGLAVIGLVSFNDRRRARTRAVP
jgi:hypothetical protein